MSIYDGSPFLTENEIAFQKRYIEESLKMGEARILELKRLIPSEYRCCQEGFDRRLLICKKATRKLSNGEEIMKIEFIPRYSEQEYGIWANCLKDAQSLMSWAAIVVEVEGGYRGFESMNDYETWSKQV